MKEQDDSERFTAAVQTLHTLLENNPKFAHGISEAAGITEQKSEKLAETKETTNEIETDGHTKSAVAQQPTISRSELNIPTQAINDFDAVATKLHEIHEHQKTLMEKSFQEILESPQNATERSMVQIAKTFLKDDEIDSLVQKNATVQQAADEVSNSQLFQSLHRINEEFREAEAMKRQAQEELELEQKNKSTVIDSLGKDFGVVDALVESITAQKLDGIDTEKDAKPKTQDKESGLGLEDVKPGATITAPVGIAEPSHNQKRSRG